MPRHNPKLNACLPITAYAAAATASLQQRRLSASLLIDAGVRPRHIRKALILSGRQFRKAWREAKANPI